MIDRFPEKPHTEERHVVVPGVVNAAAKLPGSSRAGILTSIGD
jgi:hypothetical protein